MISIFKGISKIITMVWIIMQNRWWWSKKKSDAKELSKEEEDFIDLDYKYKHASNWC